MTSRSSRSVAALALSVLVGYAFAIPQQAQEVQKKTPPPAVEDDSHEHHNQLLRASGDDEKDAQRHMDKFDANKDGKITKEEIAAALHKTYIAHHRVETYKHAAEDGLDLYGDHGKALEGIPLPDINATQMSKNEIKMLQQDYQKELAEHKKENAALLAAEHKELHEQATIDAPEVLAELDTDKDGHVCKAELKALYHQMRTVVKDPEPDEGNPPDELKDREAHPDQQEDMPSHLTGAPEMHNDAIRHEDNRVYDPSTVAPEHGQE